jgi:cyclopropane-fatty-acyl-phospholipid synthase
MTTHASTVPAALAPTATIGLIDRIARRFVLDRLRDLRRDELILADGSAEHSFGQRDELRAELVVHRPALFRSAVLGGTLGVAESYLRGDWDCDDLTSLFRIFLRNRTAADGLDAGSSWVARQAQRILHWLRDNTRVGSRRNIRAHYDLGNEFFGLWLDETLAYSSAIFTTPDQPLVAASTEKFDRVCRKLDLQPGDHLLEIGTGWGGFALHAVENYGCRVTTTTVSQRQFATARDRFEAAGLLDRITLLQQDYRELQGRFDKLASIEMIEAVGHRHFDEYFAALGRLLRPDGSLVLQAIVMPEQGYASYLRSVDFIQRYIFPGGCLPSLAAMLESAGRASDLQCVHVEDFAPHYAETLRRWRAVFRDRLDQIRSLGFTEEFLRMWTYYLCYCEAAFEERAVGVVQIQFDKPGCRRDPIRLSARAANGLRNNV